MYVTPLHLQQCHERGGLHGHVVLPPAVKQLVHVTFRSDTTDRDSAMGRGKGEGNDDRWGLVLEENGRGGG